MQQAVQQQAVQLFVTSHCTAKAPRRTHCVMWMCIRPLGLPVLPAAVQPQHAGGARSQAGTRRIAAAVAAG
jgi:hypothetical protein